MSRRTQHFFAFLALIAGSIFGLGGCTPPVAPKQEGLLHVESGTPLHESDFEQTLQATEAKLIVIQVFADACGPCITEALKLTQIKKQWHDQGIAILGLGMDETSAGPESFFSSTGGRIEYPLYWAPWFAKQQKIEATPVLFIYSTTGRQLYRTDSQQEETSPVEEISEKLLELLAKHESPEAKN